MVRTWVWSMFGGEIFYHGQPSNHAELGPAMYGSTEMCALPKYVASASNLNYIIV